MKTTIFIVILLVCAVASGVLIKVAILLLKLGKYNFKPIPNIHYDDGIPPRFYITGDKHRDFSQVERFCIEERTRRKDVLIVLGDASFNYYGDERDDELKTIVSGFSITLFCLHGNKEERPQNIGSYGMRNFCGGKVYYEPKYPNIYFAIDGEVYNFDGREYLVMGGAHSVDKQRCFELGKPYFDDEMPSDKAKSKALDNLAARGNNIYGLLTHTCPLKYLPREMFMTTREDAQKRAKKRRFTLPFLKKKTFKPDIDRSTEEWLDKLEDTVEYEEWFCGHYHIDKEIDKITMLHRHIRPLKCLTNWDRL